MSIKIERRRWMFLKVFLCRAKQTYVSRRCGSGSSSSMRAIYLSNIVEKGAMQTLKEKLNAINIATFWMRLTLNNSSLLFPALNQFLLHFFFLYSVNGTIFICRNCFTCRLFKRTMHNIWNIHNLKLLLLLFAYI